MTNNEEKITISKTTILLSSLIAVMVLTVGGTQFVTAQSEDNTKYDPAMIKELDPAFIIIGERTLEVEQKIEDVKEKIKKATTQDNDEKLQKLNNLLEILNKKYENLISAGEALGYIHWTTEADPEARAEFYKNHIPDGFEDTMEASIECGCQAVSARMGYKYPTPWGYDGDYFINPTAGKSLTKGTPEDFSRNVHATFDYIKPFGLYGVSQTNTYTVESTYDLGSYSNDDKKETLTIWDFWPHYQVIATENNVSSGTLLKGTAEWQ